MFAFPYYSNSEGVSYLWTISNCSCFDQCSSLKQLCNQLDHFFNKNLPRPLLFFYWTAENHIDACILILMIAHFLCFVLFNLSRPLRDMEALVCSIVLLYLGVSTPALSTIHLSPFIFTLCLNMCQSVCSVWVCSKLFKCLKECVHVCKWERERRWGRDNNESVCVG